MVNYAFINCSNKNDYNIRSLYPIATPDEIKELRSGSTEEKVKNLMSFGGY